MFKVAILLFCILGNALADFTLNPDFIVLERTLNTIKTVKGTLVQEIDGKQVKAEFIIKLPSRFKMEYSTNSIPVIIIINDGVLTYYDKKLDQKSQMAAPNSALKMLLRSQFSLLSKDIKILNFKTNAAETALDVSYAELENTTFKIFFKKNEVPTLYKIEVTTPSQSLTTFFENIVTNTEIRDKAFNIPNKKLDAKFNF